MFSFQDCLNALEKKHLTKNKTATAVFCVFILLKIRIPCHLQPRIILPWAVLLLFG
jgi:hypothetical protein